MFPALDLFDTYYRNEPPEDAAAGEVECKYCNAFPLEWAQARVHPRNRNVWRLVDEHGNFHACPAMKPPEASADDFEDLTEVPR